jgi:hypothetical protein
MRKLNLAGPQATDHALHTTAVSLAGRDGVAARLIQKALDTQHRAAIRRFDDAQDAATLHALWRAAMSEGDIPGAYWAVLTHPATDQQVISEVFGEVHMLSHLVGAANRADVRRLAAQEREIKALRETVTRQQDRLRVDITERDARIRDLQAMLAARATSELGVKPAEGSPELLRAVADLGRRLEAAERRGQASERRAAALGAAVVAQEARAAAAERHATELVAEVESLEAALVAVDAASRSDDDPPLHAPSAVQRTVLYVGGRTGHIAALRRSAARFGAALLHHDGGTEAAATLLAGLVGRSDIVVFPVDCVSHEAMLTVKRLCRQMGRPFCPLRSASLSSLIAALKQFTEADAR